MFHYSAYLLQLWISGDCPFIIIINNWAKYNCTEVSNCCRGGGGGKRNNCVALYNPEPIFWMVRWGAVKMPNITV